MAGIQPDAKSIERLIPDIYSLLKQEDRSWCDGNFASTFASRTADRVKGQLGERSNKASLRLSKMGASCPKALWNSIHHPELAEEIPPWAVIKYTYGHLIEALAIELSRASGHRVEGEQDELVLDGIVGHRDCVIDGCTVDVKSAATLSFNRYKSGCFDDMWGYLDQLDGYVLAAEADAIVTNKRKAYLLFVDKQLGHMFLYPHEVTDERASNLRKRIDSYKRIVSQREPPPCECGTIAQGQTGNIQLDLKASYSSYKHSCFPNLRTFIYASGPVYLTRVVKRPFNKDGPIKEIDQFGNIVYNGGVYETASHEKQDGRFLG